MLIDSHSHIYLEEFDDDLPEVIKRSQDAGVEKIVLPNVDSETIGRLMSVSKKISGHLFPFSGIASNFSK